MNSPVPATPILVTAVMSKSSSVRSLAVPVPSSSRRISTRRSSDAATPKAWDHSADVSQNGVLSPSAPVAFVAPENRTRRGSVDKDKLDKDQSQTYTVHVQQSNLRKDLVAADVVSKGTALEMRASERRHSTRKGSATRYAIEAAKAAGMEYSSYFPTGSIAGGLGSTKTSQIVRGSERLDSSTNGSSAAGTQSSDHRTRPTPSPNMSVVNHSHLNRRFSNRGPASLNDTPSAVPLDPGVRTRNTYTVGVPPYPVLTGPGGVVLEADAAIGSAAAYSSPLEVPRHLKMVLPPAKQQQLDELLGIRPPFYRGLFSCFFSDNSSSRRKSKSRVHPSNPFDIAAS